MLDKSTLGRFIPQVVFLAAICLFSDARSLAQTFSSPRQLTTSGIFPEIAVDGSGTIDVVWRDPANATTWFTRSTDSGANFSSPIELPIPPDNPAGPLQIIAESSGTIDLLATGALMGPSGTTPPAEVFYLRSTDGGLNFAVTPITGGQGAMLFAPVMALGPSGSINVMWIRGSDSKLLLSRSTDGGENFSDTTVWQWPNGLGTSGGLQLAIDPSESLYAAWSASTGAQPSNVFFTRSTDAGHSFSTPVTLASFTLVATGGDVQHTMDMHLAVVSITGSVTPLSATIGVGNSSNFNVSLTSGNGSNVQLTLASKVTLECSGAPAGVDCSFSPAETVVPGTAILTVHVASKPVVAGVSTGLQGNRPVLEDLGLILIMAGIVFFSLQERKESFIAALSRLRASSELWLATAVPGIAATVILITLAMSMVSCGGKTSGSTITSGTSFTTTNTGSSGGVGGNGGTGGTGGFGGSGTSGGGSGAGSSGGSAGGGISGANPPVTFPVTVLGQSGGTTVVLGTISITVP